MAEDFNIKKGFLKLLQKLVHNEEFVTEVINLILGRKDAADKLKAMFLRTSYDQSLNEIVVAHRLFKYNISESLDLGPVKDIKLMRKVAEIAKKNWEFQCDTLIGALKKPGVVAALYKAIKSRGTDVAAVTVLAQAVIDSAVEVAGEDEEMEVALTEGFTPNENSVNIMVGRFQPFTLGHLKCLNSIKNGLGVPTLLCVIPGNGDDKHPFRGEVQDEMLEKLEEAHPDLIAGVKYVKNAFIESWVLAAKDLGLEPVSWTCGNDRIEAYKNMVEKNGEKYGLSPDFRVCLVDRADDNISATAVRECLVDGNKEGFMKQMPECLWDMYDEMREVMVGSKMPAQQIMAEEVEEDEYFTYRKRLDEAIEKMIERGKEKRKKLNEALSDSYTIEHPCNWEHLKEASVYCHNYYRNPETGEIILEESNDDGFCEYLLVDDNLKPIKTVGCYFDDEYDGPGRSIWDSPDDIELLSPNVAW